MPLLLSDRATLVSPLPLATVAEARMLGVDLRSRTWRRLRKGVYVVRSDFEALPPWTRYAVRVHAFLRRHPDAILCLESAAVLHGLPHFGETRDIHVYDPDRTSSTRHGDVVIHTSADARIVAQIGNVLVTSMMDTVADFARLAPPAYGLAVADAATSPAQGGALEVAQLRQRIATQQNSRAERGSAGCVTTSTRVPSRWVRA